MQQHGPDAAGPSNTNIAFIELLHAQGALAALNCNGMLLGEWAVSAWGWFGLNDWLN